MKVYKIIKMNNIQKVIEDSLKGFDNQFRTGEKSWQPNLVLIKSHLTTTISNILSAIEAGVIDTLEIDSEAHARGTCSFSSVVLCLVEESRIKSHIKAIIKSAKEQIK